MPIKMRSVFDTGIGLGPDGRPPVNTERSVTALSIGQYLIRRLSDYGIRHVFGLPGDYVLSFYSMLEHSPLELVNCTRGLRGLRRRLLRPRQRLSLIHI